MEDALTAGQVFARRMREVRAARGWSQERLAEELQDLGWSLAQSTIAKIEAGAERVPVGATRRISLDDAMAICAALGVSPVDMLTPREPAARFKVAGEVVTYAGTARAWWRGWWPLRETDDPQFFYSQAPIAEMAERVRRGREAEQRGEGAAAPDHYAAMADES